MDFILLFGIIVLIFFVIGMVRRKNALADLQIQASKAPPPKPAKPPAQQLTLSDRYQLLERLQKLKAGGTLTDEEFATEKQRILASTSSTVPPLAKHTPADAPPEPEAPELINQLARYGYQIKPTGQNAWRITEPLGGRTNIAGLDDLADYVNGVMARVGR
ncbi:MAG: SHOCT domain-containing protein [Pseudomonas sp.]|nr:SHOCT domain-containing protein [Pseudomonas sp.]